MMFRITHIELVHGHRGIRFIGNQNSNGCLYIVQQNVKNKRAAMKGVMYSRVHRFVQSSAEIPTYHSLASCTYNINHTK